MQDPNKLIFVGFISSCFGIKGEVIVKSFTSPIGNICTFKLFDQNGEAVKLKLVRVNSKGDLICKYNDVNDRNIAEKILKNKLYCIRADFPLPSYNEFYVEDLKDTLVVDTKGENIGIINNIFDFGAGDIIEIKFNGGKIEMFPFKKELFSEITDESVVFIPPIILK